MTKILIKYNPFTVNTSIEVDGLDMMSNEKFKEHKADRLQVWMHKILPTLVELLSEKKMDICFHGTELDYEDIVEVFTEYTALHHDVTISLDYIAAKDTLDKVKELEELVVHMQNGPFEEFRDAKIQQNVKKALDSQFEIAVIATMSSGKSTLINAFLHEDLMPSKNQACTAKISRIKNDNNLSHFSAACFDTNGQKLQEIDDVTVEDMNGFNDNENISLIEIKGSIPSISSEKMNLVLVDTPGPNNSQDNSHREHMLRVIKDDNKPMVLYVLNATQLNTDDDFALLNIVAEAMKVGGKQSKDRFIFAVNKADCFDPEKGENLQAVLESVRQYLEKQGIENPNIYPISAESAKVIRKSKRNLPLTRHEKKVLGAIDLFLEEPIMHLERYAPLSPSTSRKIEDEMMLARDYEDEETIALYHTGVPSVEAAINEYLDKYAVTSKITSVVHSFKRVVEQRNMMQKIQRTLADDQEERARIHAQIVEVEKNIERGNKAQQLKEEIKQLHIGTEHYFEPVYKKVFDEKLQHISEQFRREKIRKAEADLILYKAKKDIEMLADDAVTDLGNKINNVIRKNAERYVDEYEAYIFDVLNVEEYKMEDWKQVIVADTPDVEEVLEDYSFEEEVVVGTRTIENTNKKWYKPWTWGQDAYYEEDVYETQEFINMKEVEDSFLGPVRYGLEEMFDGAKEHVYKEQEKLKKYFIKKIGDLELLTQERIEELKHLSSDDAQLEVKLKENEEKIQWLYAFMQKLDSILEI